MLTIITKMLTIMVPHHFVHNPIMGSDFSLGYGISHCVGGDDLVTFGEYVMDMG